MASPTLIAFSETDSGTASAGSEASATLTWQAGDVLVAFALGEGANNAVTASISNTGSGLSWANPIAHASASDCTTYAWTATASVGGSGIVTATLSTGQAMAMAVYQWRAPGGASIAIGQSALSTDGTTSPFTASITMSGPDSAVCWAVADWAANAGTSFSFSPAGTSHGVSAPGPKATPVGPTQEGTHYTFGFADLDDQAATGSQAFGVTGSGLTTPKVNVAVIEVTISGGAAPLSRAFLPLMAPQGM